MREIIKTGSTVEEAIEMALEDLDLLSEDVSVEVLEEPGKGFLGLGGKEAKVRVVADKDPVFMAERFLTDLLMQMQISAELDVEREAGQLYVEIIGENHDDMGVIIGKRGDTLDAIQYLLSLIVNKGRDQYIRVLLDTENYREKRERTLIDLANKMAAKAVRRGRSVKLDPMNPYERRIIHSALQSFEGISTYSVGDEPYRRVVIDIK